MMIVIKVVMMRITGTLRTMKMMLMTMIKSIIVQSNALRKRGMFVVNPIFFAGFLLSGEISLSPHLGERFISFSTPMR